MAEEEVATVCDQCEEEGDGLATCCICGNEVCPDCGFTVCPDCDSVSCCSCLADSGKCGECAIQLVTEEDVGDEAED